MDWRHVMNALGLQVPDSPNFNALVLAGLVIVGSFVVGWFLGGRLGGRIVGSLHRMGGSSAVFTASRVTGIVRYAVAALLLLIIDNAVQGSPLATMALATALGVATALLVFHLADLCGIGRTATWVMAIMALVAATAATLGGMQPLERSLDAIGFTAGRHHVTLLAAIVALVTVTLLYLAARAANHILAHVIGHASALDVSQQVLAQKLAGIAVVVITVFLGIDVLGIDLTALTVFSGAAGLAVGFGLQKTFGNLIAGLILLMDRSIKPGDVIVVGETFGAVSRIGVRAVSVVTRDGKEHLIPNDQLMSQAVENWSYSSRNVRIHIPVGVGYGSDLALAQRLMVEAATAAARVLPDPKPSVWLKAFGDSSVDHDILVWIADPELGVGNVRSDILNRLWVSFGQNGIELPFPQRDIHIRSMPTVGTAEPQPGSPP